MSDLDPFVSALQEARAALLNPNLHETERAASVKVIEGALDFARICGPDAEILRPATDEDLKSFTKEQ